MKFRRFLSFFKYTKAPATGFPLASLTTPVTVPLSAAQTECAPIIRTPVAIPATSLLSVFLKDIWSPPLGSRYHSDLHSGTEVMESQRKHPVRTCDEPYKGA